MLGAAALVCAMNALAADVERDVVIYGSSPAALSAAVQAKRMGKSAVIVSPETRIGGLTTGGLGQTDIGNKAAFGGLALQFYKDVADYYKDEANWTWQKRSDYLPDGQCAGSLGEDSMWTFEPSAALKILNDWEKKYGFNTNDASDAAKDAWRQALDCTVANYGIGGCGFLAGAAKTNDIVGQVNRALASKMPYDAYILWASTNDINKYSVDEQNAAIERVVLHLRENPPPFLHRIIIRNHDDLTIAKTFQPAASEIILIAYRNP